MSRHRNVRSMNYTDEYEGYDDVYGHSVEDDYAVSPSEAAFMYDREGTHKPKIGAFFQSNIPEELEPEVESQNKGQQEADPGLESRVQKMRLILGPTYSREDLVNALVLKSDNTEQAINLILNQQESNEVKNQDKGLDSSCKIKRFAIPKVNTTRPPPNFTKQSSTNNTNQMQVQFSSLADLTNNHLNKLNLNQKFNTRPNFGRPLFGEKLNDDKDVKSISQALSDTSLTATPKQLNLHASKSEGIENSWHIDLSKALKLTNALSVTKQDVNVTKKLDDFVIPFIECDVAISKPSQPKRFCMLDISSMADQNFRQSKMPSGFGKALCRKYRRSKAYEIVSSEQAMYKQAKQFLFDCPSPDDVILKHLKLRKLPT